MQEKNRKVTLVKDYIHAVDRHLEGKPYQKHVKGIIDISNRDEDDPGLTRLRKTIIDVASKQPHWREPRPIRWLMLADKLDQVRISYPKDPTMTLDEVQTTALGLGMEKF